MIKFLIRKNILEFYFKKNSFFYNSHKRNFFLNVFYREKTYVLNNRIKYRSYNDGNKNVIKKIFQKIYLNHKLKKITLLL